MSSRRNADTSAGVSTCKKSGGVFAGRGGHDKNSRIAADGRTTPSAVLALPLPRWHTLKAGSVEWVEFVRAVYGWTDADLFARVSEHNAVAKILRDDLWAKPGDGPGDYMRGGGWDDVDDLLRRVMAFRWLQDHAVGSRKDAKTQRKEGRAVGLTSDFRPLISKDEGGAL